MKKFVLLLVAFLIITAMFDGVTAHADDFPVPNPEILESEDGSRIFVFNPYGDEAYPAMGVYSNTEPIELIYTINLQHMAFKINFYFSSDMQYFVFIPEASQNIALEFYGNGDMIQMYWIGNLVKNMDKVSYSISMAFWENRNRRNFDITNNTLSITTVDDLTYVFDITTGKALRGEIIGSHGNILDPDDLVQPELPFVEQGPGTLILEGPYGMIEVDVIIGHTDEADATDLRYDRSLIVGVTVFAVCVAGLIVGLVLLRVNRKKKENGVKI